MMMMHLLLRSETVAVRGRMNLVLYYYDGQVKPGDECEIPDISLILEEKRLKNLNHETDLTGERT